MLGRRIIAATVLSVLSSFTSVAMAQDWIYTTTKGDNLWNLSEQYLDRVTRFEALRKINGIENPKQMPPGIKLRIPLKWIRSNPVPATVDELLGDAQLQRAGSSEQVALQHGDEVFLGDQIRTGGDSTLAIRFADDSILTLYADSLIRFDHLSAHGKTGMVDSRLNLIQGRMDTRVTPASGPGSRFEIQTPSAISAVRGTEYRALVGEDGKISNIEVLHGKVKVSGAGKHTLVKRGFGTQVAEGKAPIKPRKLLPAPGLTAFDAPVRNISQLVSWPAVDKAQAYRAEVSADADFDVVQWSRISEYAKIALPDIADGEYYLRVRAIDSLGLEGLNSVQPFVLDAHPQPPLQLQPVPEQVLRGETAVLQWTASADAARYRLEVATDEAFTQLVVDQDDITGSRFDTADLPVPGKYYWRLTSITSSGEHGPVGISRSWQVKPAPEKVEAAVGAAEDGKLVASWRAGSAEQQYQVQMATDENFEDLLLDQMQDEARISFDAVEGQVRYLRVRSVESDGYQGPWGTVQRILPIPDYTPLWLSGAAMLLLIL
ncbi:FecR family protein [Aliamphritea spongicola]|uniref:FecR domain-containing protein n=1 Tax=Aliamphritea spongicola TaxID=707589 RepID=UPI00196A4C82|nr:FecR domain-containing protein [Aliamphritea spongicola]MBN3562528.1 FecR domain-containing protein [Aliamphritea spongicola]